MGVLVHADEAAPGYCAKCGESMHVRKTLRRAGKTVEHGTFQVRETVYICPTGCTQEKVSLSGNKSKRMPVTRRSAMLAELLMPRRSMGYDLMAFVGQQRWLHRRQRDEIQTMLEQRQVVVSAGEITILAHDFLVYLEELHKKRAPFLRATLAKDGGYPLHIDATGESGRGTLLAAFAGWRRWVLGAWKIPTERADAMLPRLREVTNRFGPPCAIMRDLGPAVIDTARELARELGGDTPVLGCHFHYLRDVGKDLLTEGHDALRDLFRRYKVRPNLRALARDLGRQLGPDIVSTREDVVRWLAEPAEAHELPSGDIGLAMVRALAQWALDYMADSNDEGFPFELPYLDFQRRCRQILSAVEAFLRVPHPEPTVRRALERLHRMVEPVRSQVPFQRQADVLERRERIFDELRRALRLQVKPSGDVTAPCADSKALADLCKIEAAVAKLTASLRQRRPQRGPAENSRKAIDVVLTHLDRHGPSLWGHAIALPPTAGGGIRLVDRTNLLLEAFFGFVKHGERRRSGRKNLGQDLEQLPAGALLAQNLAHSDYVEILCGSLDNLPREFAKLDSSDRRYALPVRKRAAPDQPTDVASSSLPKADRAIIRSEELEERLFAAARSRAPRRQPTRKRRAATLD
jgi:hypothetical protein